MNWFEVLRLTMLVAHFVGLAAIIGPFLLQLRTREGFRLGTMRVGAVVQIVSGNLLIASRRLQGLDVIEEKMIVKMGIALLVLAAVIVASVIQRRARRSASPDHAARPWMLTAGTLAIAGAAIAAIWT